MIPSNAVPKFLFVINAASGSNDTDWEQLLRQHYQDAAINIVLHPMPKDCNVDLIREKINEEKPDRVVAVGGDGTVKLVAEALLHSDIPLGILPAGSANGMAKEFNITGSVEDALEVIKKGCIRPIHLVTINNQVCIHLADVGFNAKVVKHFEEDNTRGMWGYVKSAWKVLWQHRRMQVKVQTKDALLLRNATMVVIANGTRYGNGVLINPLGSLFDEQFEVVIVREISLIEIVKMRLHSRRLNQEKTEVLQTHQLELHSNRDMHFQIDGEYMDKTKTLVARIIPNAIRVVMPAALQDER